MANSVTRRPAMTWAIIAVVTWAALASAADWTGFRGPGTLGVSDETGLPITWSETENLAWKTPLPGPGSSSPIVLGNRVFVTCYSGYGLDPNEPGDPNNLKRHLLCIRTADGQILWDTAVPALLPEDPYRGMIREHGYASQTPTTDGQRVYVFFGKTGVLAFDLNGKQLWKTNVGTDSDQKKWGTATSPAVYKNLVFVNAWDEAKTLYALDARTGREIWKKQSPSEPRLSFTTPVVTKRADGRAELVVSVPSQIWGLDPETGRQLWYVRTGIKDDMIPSPLILDGIAYIHGGGPRQHGSLAIRIGGDGDVTDTHVLWSAKNVASPPSPVIVDDLMYWANAYGNTCCADTKTGELRYSDKLPISQRFAVYASALAAEGRIYIVTRKDGTFVLPARPEFEIIARNQFASDDTDFNASPAISNKRLFLRSNRFLYCVRRTP